jgi:nucleoid-associated protein YgaU
MSTKGKVALLGLMVALVVAIFIFDKLSNKDEAVPLPHLPEAPAVDNPLASLPPAPSTPFDSPAGPSSTLPPSSAPAPVTPAPPVVYDGPSSPGPGAAPSTSPPVFASGPSSSSPGAASKSGSGPTSTPPPVFDGSARPGGPTSPFEPPPSSSFGAPSSSDPFGGTSSFGAPSGGKTYKIQEGDSLWSIAQRHYKDGTKWERIRDANKDKLGEGKFLKVGTEIVIPDVETAAAPSGLSPVTDAGPGEYKVKSGDSLSSIAKSQLGSEKFWEEIAKANEDKLQGNPHRLKVGMMLRIPAKSDLPVAGGRMPILQQGEVPPELIGKRTYQIKSGDSLWKIAQKELGDGTKWEKILELNRDRIDPTHLKVGDTIVLPEDGGGFGAPGEPAFPPEPPPSFPPPPPVPPTSTAPPPTTTAPR